MEPNEVFAIGEGEKAENNEDKMPCDQPGCNYIAKNYLGLQIHKRFTHDIEGEGAKYRRQTQAKRKAMQGAKGMKQCPYCSFQTWHKSSYKRHMNQLHPDETGYARINKPVQIEPPKKTEKPDVELRDRIAELVADKIFNKLMS